MKRMMLVRAPLSDSETEEIAIQSQFLQDAGIEGMAKSTADELAEYFVRCHRVDPAESEATIAGGRYEKLPTKERGVHWGFWILTSSNGTDYWFYGFSEDTFDNRFYVIFVSRDRPYGGTLYGSYK